MLHLEYATISINARHASMGWHPTFKGSLFIPHASETAGDLIPMQFYFRIWCIKS